MQNIPKFIRLVRDKESIVLEIDGVQFKSSDAVPIQSVGYNLNINQPPMITLGLVAERVEIVDKF